MSLEDENEQPIKDYCAENIKVTRFFIIVSCASYDNFRGIVYIYMRPGMYTKMNRVPWLGDLILVKTFYGTHQGSKFGQPDSLENNLQITDNQNDNITHIHIVTREQVKDMPNQQRVTREQLKDMPNQQSLAVISIIGKGLDHVDYS